MCSVRFLGQSGPPPVLVTPEIGLDLKDAFIYPLSGFPGGGYGLTWNFPLDSNTRKSKHAARSTEYFNIRGECEMRTACQWTRYKTLERARPHRL